MTSTHTPTAVRTWNRAGTTATITVTHADGTTVKVGGQRAARAAAVILATWATDDRCPGFYGARADLHAAHVEAHRLATATTVRAGRLHHPRTPAREAVVLEVVDA